MTAVALHSTETEITRAGASNDAVLARFRRLGAISRALHSAAMDALPRDRVARMGRRLGLVQGKTLELESLDELDFVFDLLIYTAPPGETRPIDRCARKVDFATGSDEAMMLGAMRALRFAMVRVERRHDIAGLMLADLVRGGARTRAVPAQEDNAGDGGGSRVRRGDLSRRARTEHLRDSQV